MLVSTTTDTTNLIQELILDSQSCEESRSSQASQRRTWNQQLKLAKQGIKTTSHIFTDWKIQMWSQPDVKQSNGGVMQ